MLSAISGSAALCTSTSYSYSDSYFGGTWSSSNPSVATINSATGAVNALTAGTTTISYSATNIYGCSTTVTQNDTVTARPVAGTMSGTTTTVCAHSQISFSTGVSGGTWSSSDVATATVDGSGNVTGVGAGFCTISYTVSNSCGSVSATVDIEVDPTPALSAITGPTTVCTGNTYSLTNTTFGGTWSSSNTSVATINATGAMTTIASGNTLISYMVTNVYGCSDTVTMADTVNPSPSAGSITATTTTICSGFGVTFTDGATGGTWSSSDTMVASVSSAGAVSGRTPGSATISYTVSNSYGCSQSATTAVTVNPSPAISPITGPTSMCSGSTLTVSDAAAGGTWSSSNTPVATIDPSTGVVIGLATGTATLTYSITNAYGCTVTEVYPDTVSSAPSAGIISGATSLCSNDSMMMTSSATGGTWSTSNALIATANASTGEIYGVTAGYVNITYTVSTSGGCSAWVSKSDTINLAPFVDTISGSSALCARYVRTLG
jgi:uncharacterized protein YjdB